MWVKIEHGSHREQVGDSSVLHTPNQRPIFRLSLEDYQRFGGEDKFQIIGLSNNKPEPDKDGNYPNIKVDPETGEKLYEE